MNIIEKLKIIPCIKKLRQLLMKYKEQLLYLFFGGLSFLVSISTFAYFEKVININELFSNVLSWLVTVMFAFLTNRIWVFSSKTKNWKEFVRQMYSFYMGRVVTLILEELILLIFVTWLNLNSIVVKLIAQVIVIILNYIISKFIIFAPEK